MCTKKFEKSVGKPAHGRERVKFHLGFSFQVLESVGSIRIKVGKTTEPKYIFSFSQHCFLEQIWVGPWKGLNEGRMPQLLTWMGGRYRNLSTKEQPTGTTVPVHFNRHLNELNFIALTSRRAFLSVPASFPLRLPQESFFRLTLCHGESLTRRSSLFNRFKTFLYLHFNLQKTTKI